MQSISQEWFENWARFCQDGGVLTPGLWFASQSNLLAVMPAPKKDICRMVTADQAELIEAIVMQLADKDLATAEAFRAKWLAHPCYGHIDVEGVRDREPDLTPKKARFFGVRLKLAQRIASAKMEREVPVNLVDPITEHKYFELVKSAQLYVDAHLLASVNRARPVDVLDVVSPLLAEAVRKTCKGSHAVSKSSWAKIKRTAMLFG